MTARCAHFLFIGSPPLPHVGCSFRAGEFKSSKALHEKSAPRAHHSRGREQGSARIGGMSRCVLTALSWLWVTEGAKRIQFCNPSHINRCCGQAALSAG